jgi:3-hydroxybutyryl-CoA dehydratase
MALQGQFVQERPFEEIELGESFSITKSITESDVITFAGLVGDFNPIHVNLEFAGKSMFGQRLAHGMLSASFISAAIGTGLPGINSIYLSQNSKFVKPVFIGDTITATVEVTEKIEAKRRLVLHTVVTNQRGEVVVDGEAQIMVMKKN